MLTRMVSISWPRDPPTSASQSAGITGLSHSARPSNRIFLTNKQWSLFLKCRENCTGTTSTQLMSKEQVTPNKAMQKGSTSHGCHELTSWSHVAYKCKGYISLKISISSSFVHSYLCFPGSFQITYPYSNPIWQAERGVISVSGKVMAV